MRTKSSQPINRFLITAGWMTAAISLLHIGIVLGGPTWYRFFGAGEMMAQQAEQGLAEPVIVTLTIALVLAIWAAYAFSGAGLAPRMPFLKPILILVCGVFLLRGVLGIPLVNAIDDPYFNELEQRPIFMTVSSIICLFFAWVYARGILAMKKQ